MTHEVWFERAWFIFVWFCSELSRLVKGRTGMEPEIRSVKFSFFGISSLINSQGRTETVREIFSWWNSSTICPVFRLNRALSRAFSLLSLVELAELDMSHNMSHNKTNLKIVLHTLCIWWRGWFMKVRIKWKSGIARNGKVLDTSRVKLFPSFVLAAHFCKYLQTFWTKIWVISMSHYIRTLNPESYVNKKAIGVIFRDELFEENICLEEFDSIV